MARTKIVIDHEKVERLAARGLSNVQIAQALGIGRTTLQMGIRQSEQLEQAIKIGKAKGIATVANVLFEKAKAGHPWAVCFYLKTAGGWKENVGIEMAPIAPPTINVNFPNSAVD